MKKIEKIDLTSISPDGAILYDIDSALKEAILKLNEVIQTINELNNKFEKHLVRSYEKQDKIKDKI